MKNNMMRGFVLLIVFLLISGCNALESTSVAVLPTTTYTPVILSTLTPTHVPTETPIAVTEQPEIDSSTGLNVKEAYSLRGHTEGAVGFVFSPDSDQLISLDGNSRLYRWNLHDGTQADTLTVPGTRVYNIAFSSDARWLAIGNQPADSVSIWDALSGDPSHVLTGNQAFIMKVVFSPDGTMVAAGDSGGTIAIWNVESGETIHILQSNGTIGSLAFSPDGTILASGNAEGHTDIELWDMNTGQLSLILEGHHGNVYNLVFTPDGEHLISSSGGNDRTVRFWKISSGEEIHKLRGHEDYIYGLAITADGQYLASASADGMIKLWDVTSGDELSTVYGSPEVIFHLAFSLDGLYLASGGMDDAVTIWEIIP